MSSESWTRQQELHPLEYFPQLVTGGSAVCPAVKRLCVLSKRESQKEEKTSSHKLTSTCAFIIASFMLPQTDYLCKTFFKCFNIFSV